MSPYEREGARNIVGKINIDRGSKQLFGGIGIPSTFKAINWSHTDEVSYYGITHSSQMNSLTYPANWWVFGYGTADDAQCLAMASYNAKWPSGVPLNINGAPSIYELWVPRNRFFVGKTVNGDPASIEFADSQPTTGHSLCARFARVEGQPHPRRSARVAVRRGHAIQQRGSGHRKHRGGLGTDWSVGRVTMVEA